MTSLIAVVALQTDQTSIDSFHYREKINTNSFRSKYKMKILYPSFMAVEATTAHR
jgi:hypothetical protein